MDRVQSRIGARGQLPALFVASLQPRRLGGPPPVRRDIAGWTGVYIYGHHVISPSVAQQTWAPIPQGPAAALLETGALAAPARVPLMPDGTVVWLASELLSFNGLFGAYFAIRAAANI